MTVLHRTLPQSLAAVALALLWPCAPALAGHVGAGRAIDQHVQRVAGRVNAAVAWPRASGHRAASNRRPHRAQTKRGAARRSRRARRRLQRLQGGPAYVVRDPRRSWGTRLAVSTIHEVLGDFHERYPNARKVRVMDLSRRWGGRLKPHKSHRSGRDVDITYPIKPGYPNFAWATPRNLDVERAWDLLERFVDTGDVVFIFCEYRLQRRLYRQARRAGVPTEKLERVFQYPHGKRTNSGIIRHAHGHATHFHVRFRPEPLEQPPTS